MRTIIKVNDCLLEHMDWRLTFGVVNGLMKLFRTYKKAPFEFDNFIGIAVAAAAKRLAVKATNRKTG